MNHISCPLQKTACESGDIPFLITPDKTFSYKEFEYAVLSAAEFLKTLGIKPNERIALLSPPSAHYIIALFSLWRIGAAACLMNTRLPEQTLNRQLKTIVCNYILTSIRGKDLQKNRTKPFDPGRLSFRSLSLDRTMERRLVKIPKEFLKKCEYSLDQKATIIFTSGSTAEPKAVLHTIGNHYYSALGSNEHLALKEQDRWLMSLPLYHVSGLSLVFRTALAKASLVIPEEGISLAEAVKKYKVTHVSLVPAQFYHLLKNPKDIAILQKLKVILLGGSSIPRNLLQSSIEHGLPVYVTYGLSETASQVAVSEKITKLEDAEKLKVLKYREAAVSEENEILIRGKTLSPGYIRGVRCKLPLNFDHYFKTGDLGSSNQENYLKVTGRKDNMFICGGENIQPEEIEQYLTLIRTIEEALVLPVKDKKFGFRPVAFIKRKGEVKKETIRQFLEKYLPKFKIPEKFYLWPENKRRIELKRNRIRFAEILKRKKEELKTL